MTARNAFFITPKGTSVTVAERAGAEPPPTGTQPTLVPMVALHADFVVQWRLSSAAAAATTAYSANRAPARDAASSSVLDILALRIWTWSCAQGVEGYEARST